MVRYSVLFRKFKPSHIHIVISFIWALTIKVAMIVDLFWYIHFLCILCDKVCNITHLWIGKFKYSKYIIIYKLKNVVGLFDSEYVVQKVIMIIERFELEITLHSFVLFLFECDITAWNIKYRKSFILLYIGSQMVLQNAVLGIQLKWWITFRRC